LDLAAALRQLKRDHSTTLIENGIAGVGDQVQQHLADLSQIADRQWNRLQPALDPNVQLGQLALDQRQRLLDGIANLMQRALWIAAACEGQQAAGDAATAQTRPRRHIERLIFFIDIIAEQAELRIAQNAGQQVVELMRNSSRKG